MALIFDKLHPGFAASVDGVDLREVHDAATLEVIRAGMDEYAVLVFRDQKFSNSGQLEFAKRFDGELHSKTGASVLGRNRLGDEALSDISNVDENGEIMDSNDRRRMYALGNRLWHTDASFQDPPGRYSMLFACVVPPVAANTDFSDSRAAFEALDPELRARLEGMQVHHTITHSRAQLGFEFSAEEQARLKGAVHPMVVVNPRTGRKALYLASHAAKVIGMPVPDGRLLIRELMDHAIQSEFVYSHAWRTGDLVIWDNKATMHRGRTYDDAKYRREMRRVTTLDLPA